MVLIEFKENEFEEIRKAVHFVSYTIEVLQKSRSSLMGSNTWNGICTATKLNLL